MGRRILFAAFMVLCGAAAQAKKFQVQRLSFPELYVPGYILSPETARKAAETREGPRPGRES